MKNLLLPHCFKRVGWIILIPTAILSIMMCFDDFNGVPTYLYSTSSTSVGVNVNDHVYNMLISQTTTHILNNIALIGVLLGCLFITCSRQRIEDELSERIRLNALLVALYIYFSVSIVMALVFYDEAFFEVMIYNLVALPLLFLATYLAMLWRFKRSLHDEE